MAASSNVLYDLSVPVFERGLQNLAGVLKTGEKWCEENNVDKKTLLEGRIAPDMLVRCLFPSLVSLSYSSLIVRAPSLPITLLLALDFPGPSLQ